MELRELFSEMTRTGASDLHLVVGAPPQLRVQGDLQSIEGMEILRPEHTRELIFGILSNEQRQKLEVQWEIDFSYSVPGLARWRVNAFFQRGALGAAFRIIPEKIKPLSDLGVPDSLYKLCNLPRGLVLVTGPTGSGKSTTLAAMIDVINEQRCEHILTVEDPIEFIHQHKNCIINQREVGADTEGFARALKSALRQDPDIVLVGEMRDLETIQTALTAAETGHLVFGTLHTNGAAKTVDRVIDAFPPHQQAQIRTQLASSLQGVVTQTLVPTIDGKGRVVAAEVMIPNSAIRNLIREGKIFQIPSVMQTSQEDGMQTLDASLATLVRTNRITRAEALKRCSEETDFERLVSSGSGAPAAGQAMYQPPARVRLRRKFDQLGEQSDGPEKPGGIPASVGAGAPGHSAPPQAQAHAPAPVPAQAPAPAAPAQAAPAAAPPMEFRPAAPAAQAPAPGQMPAPAAPQVQQQPGAVPQQMHQQVQHPQQPQQPQHPQAPMQVQQPAQAQAPAAPAQMMQPPAGMPVMPGAPQHQQQQAPAPAGAPGIQFPGAPPAA